MIKKILLIMSMLLIAGIFIGCAGGKAEIDPDAYMTGDKIGVTKDIEFSVMTLLESTGSDYAKPDKGYIFNTVKFKLINNSQEPIELNEDDFKIVYGEKEYAAITGKLNFVLDKMPANIIVEPGQELVSRLVWMVPNKPALKVLVFKPSFASEEIRVNLNEEK